MSEEQEEAPEKKSKVLIISLIVVSCALLICLGLIGGFFLFSGSEKDPEEIADKIITGESKTSPEEAENSEKEEEEEIECPEGEEGDECRKNKTPTKQSKESKKAEIFQTLYFAFPGNITSNIKGSRKFVQVGITVATKYDAAIIENVERHIPTLQSVILALLSEKTEEQLVGVPARKELADAIKVVMNKELESLEGFGGVEAVLFQSFVIQ